MKKIALILSISLMGPKAFSSDIVDDMLKQSIQATTIQVTANIVAGIILEISDATSRDISYGYRKREARLIQNDIQVYALSGELSLYLTEKLKTVYAVNSELSEGEALDVLDLAAKQILV